MIPRACHLTLGRDALIVCAGRWIPRGDWGCSSDPSGRSVSIHQAAYDAKETSS